ncbi:branched chain amino acid aminotransferase [Paenibacillus selenitireducens]|uniref:Branched-chain-amino-acid aminotransferase n=1 Tax=Paenibacillus selenitireducens TaxID=1324314 RepID=A0A1T2XHB0_9BACL|nr:branched-chain amino acid aminotransferase [Paenibacillus selenitireducens]OPA79279.1 branched chain amino acid aminotransferase [Paenibacillus selenitireducens]
MAHTITIEYTTKKKQQPHVNQLGFGKYFTDHMFIMDYDTEKGWYDPRIVPYQPILMDPASKVFHYGQTVFEGLKAYKTADERILLFRPDKNMKRLNKSNDRLSIPAIDEELALEALKQLILTDQDWIPEAVGTSLYVRPFVIATESCLGVAPSRQYKFMIILSPVGSYYAEGINPVSIHVESEYVRAVAGGVGNAKTAGNYAAGLKAQEGATDLGYAQVLWLDGVHRKYIEEVGSMNVFFRINDTVVTPMINGSILEGITRATVIELLQHWNIPVEERRISIEELVEAQHNGSLKEAFGTGTAAVISPIGSLHYQDEKLVLGDGITGELSKKIYDAVTGIQNGVLPDTYGWTIEI